MSRETSSYLNQRQCDASQPDAIILCIFNGNIVELANRESISDDSDDLESFQ
jgi:hypothetical protein